MIVYKIWDTYHKAYTVNEGRPSNNKHHPGRIYTTHGDVKACLTKCEEFYGDLSLKQVHVFKLQPTGEYGGTSFLKT
jgi:hypothetical protein